MRPTDSREKRPKAWPRHVASALLALVAVAAIAGSGQAATKAAPTNTAPPTVTGTPRVGQTLTTSNGTWSNSPTDYAYQWLRCNASGAGCVAVANGNTKTYTLIPADAGHTMRSRVTASNADGSTSAQSEPTAAGTSSAVLRNTDRPIVSGTPEQGETLTVDEGTWTGSPTSYTYRWQRCEADNIVSCADIFGATSSSYLIRAIDVGYRLRALVTARNANGSAVAASATTAVVRPKLKVTNSKPTLTILSVKILGHTVYARFRICDDSNKNVTIIATDSRPGKASYTRRFSTLTAPAPCGVYTRHWRPAARFRGAGRFTVTLTARDKSGFSSAPAHRTFARG
jgi:hypothetical protein